MSKGFTLFEILIVLSIIMILASFSYPHLEFLFEHAQSQQLQSQLLQVIAQARAASDRRRLPVGICGSMDQAACALTWLNGQLIFIDSYLNGEIKQTSQVITAFSSPKAKGHLYWRAYPNYRAYLQFQPDQWRYGDNATFWYCRPKQQIPDWAIVINQAARARVVLPKNGVLIDNNRLLSCNS